MRLFATALLAGLCLIIGIYPLAYVLTDDRFGLLQSKPDAVVGSSWWRLGFHAHILSGGVALSVGWSQFVHGWRTRFPRVHRAVGRLYVVLVLVSGLAALSIAPYTSTGWVAALAFGILAVIWLTVTVLAWDSIRRRDVQRHKAFMVYSFSACCAAVTLRLWLPVLLLVLRLDFSVAYPIVAWLCWVPNLLVARLINSRTAAASR